MALQRGSTVRMASDVSDADIMGLLQQGQPRDVASMLPAGWSGFNESQKLQWFNENQVTPQELLNAGVDQQTINTMSQRGYTGGAAAAPAPAPAPAPAAAPAAAPTVSPMAGFDPSQGVQRIGGMIYQPIYESTGSGEEFQQGPLVEVIRYPENQTGAGQSYERLDPTTLQPTGTGQFQETGGVGKLVRTAAEDLGPLALAALGVNPGLAAGLGSAAASALGIPVASTAGAAGLTAGQVAALGSGLASTGIGLAQGKNVLDAIKSGLLSGATGMVPELAGNLVPATGNLAVDSALKSAVASGTKAALSGQSVEEAVLGALTASGLGSATGLDPKVIGNAVKVITSGGDPQAIFNTIVSAAQGGATPAAASATQTPAGASGQLASETERLQQLASTATPFPDQPVTSESLGQALVDLQQGAGDQLAFAGAIPGLVGAASETAAAAAARAAITRALQTSAEAAIPAIQQAAAASPAVAQALASPAVQRVLAGLASAGIATGPLLGFLSQPTDTGDETARLASRYPAPAEPATAPQTQTTAQATSGVAPAQPNVDPLAQLAQQTTGTALDVTGDPYAPQDQPAVSPSITTQQPVTVTGNELGTADAQRLAELLNIDINTASGLLASSPDLYGQLIGQTTTGFKPADIETMSSTDIRLLESIIKQAQEEEQNRLATGSTTAAEPVAAPQNTSTYTVVTVDNATNKALVIDATGTSKVIDTTQTQLEPGTSVQVNNLTNTVVEPTQQVTQTSTEPITTATDAGVTTPTLTPVTLTGTGTPTQTDLVTSLTPAPSPTTTTTQTETKTPTTPPPGSLLTPITPAATPPAPTTAPRPNLGTPVTEPVGTVLTPPPPPPAPTPSPTPPPPAPTPSPTPPPPAPTPSPTPAPAPRPDLGTAVEEPIGTAKTPPPAPPPPEPPPPPQEPETTPAPPPPPPTTYIYDPTKTSVLTKALSVEPTAGVPGRVGLAYARPAGEIESEVTGKKRRNVWNEASLRLRDALGL